MNTLLITQSQFNEIDDCMRYMENAFADVGRFTEALGIHRQSGIVLPVAATQAGAAQARIWRSKINPHLSIDIRAQLEETAAFCNEMVRRLSALSRAEKKGPVSDLSNVAVPPGPPPRYATSPITNCQQLLRYHQQWVWPWVEVLKTSQSGSDDRQAIHDSLPRVMDFMSSHLLVATTRRPRPAGLRSARKQHETVGRHYTRGLGGTANFLAQHRRIMALLGQASHHYSQLEKAQSMARFETEMTLVANDLNRGLSVWQQFLALGAHK